MNHTKLNFDLSDASKNCVKIWILTLNYKKFLHLYKSIGLENYNELVYFAHYIDVNIWQTDMIQNIDGNIIHLHVFKQITKH